MPPLPPPPLSSSSDTDTPLRLACFSSRLDRPGLLLQNGSGDALGLDAGDDPVDLSILDTTGSEFVPELLRLYDCIRLVILLRSKISLPMNLMSLLLVLL